MTAIVPAAGTLRDVADLIAEAFRMIGPSDYDAASEEAAQEVATYLRREHGIEIDR
jgi:hypothetical protein